MNYISECRALAIILLAAEQSYYTIHNQIKETDFERTPTMIYSANSVKGNDNRQLHSHCLTRELFRVFVNHLNLQHINSSL